MASGNLAFLKAQRNFKLKTGGQEMVITTVNGERFSSDGRLWVRPAGGFSDGSTVVNPSPSLMRVATNANLIADHGRKVYVGIGYDGRLEVKGNTHEDLRQAGINPRQLNPLDPATRYKTTGLISDLASFPDGGTGTVMVHGAWYRKANGSYGVYAGETGIDLLSSYTPATSTNQLIACLWLNTSTNGIEVTASSEFSQGTDLATSPSSAVSYILECVNQAPAENIGVWAWIVRGDDTVIDETNKFCDLRGIIGSGSSTSVSAFPIDVDTAVTVASNTQIVVDEYTISTGGSVVIDGRITII